MIVTWTCPRIVASVLTQVTTSDVNRLRGWNEKHLNCYPEVTNLQVDWMTFNQFENVKCFRMSGEVWRERLKLEVVYCCNGNDWTCKPREDSSVEEICVHIGQGAVIDFFQLNRALHFSCVCRKTRNGRRSRCSLCLLLMLRWFR